ncbi:MAG: hypothetical protein JW780_08300 [Clostridiales bacterium]|nr:hypothetical protein [Clostridiales bacterium]
MKIKSLVAFLVAASVCAASLLSSCSFFDHSEEEIETIVREYMEEIKSGSFSNNQYRSGLVKDDPFSLMVYKDEAVQNCMNVSLNRIQYEIREVSVDRKAKTADCTVLLTYVDIDSVMSKFGDEWITAESLTEQISAENAPTLQDEVLLYMERENETDKWMVSASSQVAIALGLPYSEINLFTQAGNPEDAFREFMKSLKSGDSEEIALFLKEETEYSEMFPENIDNKIRKAFFVNTRYEIINTQFEGNACNMEVNFRYVDLQEVEDIISQSTDLQCEVFKFVYTQTIATNQEASMDAYDACLVDLCCRSINTGTAGRLEETIDLRMVLSEDGTLWQIEGVPGFMTKTDQTRSEPDAMVMYSATGMAIIELYEEGVITKKQRDQELKKFELEDLKYSTRQVVASVDFYDTYDLEKFMMSTTFNSEETKTVAFFVLFTEEWPGLETSVLLYRDGEEEAIGLYSVSVYSDTPDTLFGNLLYSSNSNWPVGEYTIEVVLPDLICLATMEFEVV